MDCPGFSGRLVKSQSIGLLNLHGGLVIQTLMGPLAVVKDFDELEYSTSRIGPVRVGTGFQEFEFQRRKEALCHGIVPAVAFA